MLKWLFDVGVDQCHRHSSITVMPPLMSGQHGNSARDFLVLPSKLQPFIALSALTFLRLDPPPKVVGRCPIAIPRLLRLPLTNQSLHVFVPLRKLLLHGITKVSGKMLEVLTLSSDFDHVPRSVANLRRIDSAHRKIEQPLSALGVPHSLLLTPIGFAFSSSFTAPLPPSRCLSASGFPRHRAIRTSK